MILGDTFCSLTINRRPKANMWDDEDNNPYGSFHRRDSDPSDIQSPNDRECYRFYLISPCEPDQVLSKHCDRVQSSINAAIRPLIARDDTYIGRPPN